MRVLLLNRFCVGRPIRISTWIFSSSFHVGFLKDNDTEVTVFDIDFVGRGGKGGSCQLLYKREGNQTKKENTDLHVFLPLPGNGGPHAIFLPRQKKHASGGFCSGGFLEGIELRPIDGDFGVLVRNSVGAGVIWRDGTCNGLDELAYDRP